MVIRSGQNKWCSLEAHKGGSVEAVTNKQQTAGRTHMQNFGLTSVE